MLSALLALRLAVAGANAQVRELPPYPIARYAVGSIAAPGREAALGLELGAALPAWPSNSYTLSIPQALPAASAAPAALPAAAAAAAPILPATAPQAAEPAGAEQRPSAESASAQAARRFDGLPAAPADESKSYWVTLEPGTAVERLWDNEGSPIDSAVELELDMSPAVMALITTDDGTLHPLLDGISAPGWLKKIKAARDRRPADLADLKWDELSYSQQRRLILHDSAARRAKFGATAATRKIRGLKTRTSWTINLRRSTILFGKRYPKGRQVVDLPGILEPNVEYGNPNSVRTLELVELHLRGNFRAGRLSGDAWTLLRAAGIPLTHQHVHSVAPLPAAIKSHNALAVITLAERQRVLETAAHMIAIVHERRSVIEGKDEQGNIFFAPMDRSQLHKLVTTLLSYRFNLGRISSDDHLESLLRELLGETIFMLKPWMGFRTGLYDRPGVYGHETRFLRRRSPRRLTQAFLDAIQRSMLKGELSGPKQRQFERWLRRRLDRFGRGKTHNLAGRLQRLDEKELGSLLSSAYYLYDAPSFSLKEMLMLLHNWSQDPLIFNDAAAARRVEAAQGAAVEALQAQLWQRGLASHWRDIMKRFLLDSGLYEIFLDAVGVPPALRYAPRGAQRPS